MSKRIEFLAVVDRVLSGACRVEQYDSDSPDLSTSDDADAVSVVMHRDAPGVVALVGCLDGAFFISGCFSGRLRAFLLREHATEFVFKDSYDPDGSVRFLMRFCARVGSGESIDQSGLYILEGIDAVELLHALKHVSNSSVLPPAVLMQ